MTSTDTMRLPVTGDDWFDLGALHGFFVYCLYSADQVCPIYIGSSRNIHNRIGQHVMRFGAELVSASAKRCTSERVMSGLESDLIHEYQPEHNIEGRAGQRRVKGYWSTGAFRKDHPASRVLPASRGDH